jgi:ABC-type sugar transport system ATPase subunit
MTAILEFRGATKTFRGIPAIKDIDFTLRRGEIHAIVGENGAGKSTLMKVLAGVYELNAGTLTFDGEPLILKSPADAIARGIAMVFQETNLVPSMTVAQNIYLGEEHLFNRLRGALHPGSAIPVIVEFLCRSNGSGLVTGSRQEADGRDCARGPSPRARSHL